jgi:hypothetical protein
MKKSQQMIAEEMTKLKKVPGVSGVQTVVLPIYPSVSMKIDPLAHWKFAVAYWVNNFQKKMD